jgi:4-diphosphocytidyl-2-C-methyl-D-erythritol kinase
MVVFPNAKINIGLQILGKRTDGYHNLHTIFFPVNLKDALEVIESESKDEEIVFSHSGRKIAGDVKENICYKAYHLIKKDFPELPNVCVHLHKNIPMGAGLGGGSADGSFMLALLNEKFKLKISQENLLKYALQLGSDCPFFIINKPCEAFGRGEELKEISLDLSAYKILLVNPGIHVNTAKAFSQIKPNANQKDFLSAIQKPISEWKNFITNDFEEVVFKDHPAVEIIKNELYSRGALFASMSGSGSSVYGIFENEFETNSIFNED